MTSPIWHPFTQHALRSEFFQISRAEGAYLTTESGQTIIDAISSWWVITHGHGHPHIVAAIQAQAQILDQVIFAEYTHEPAERLAAKLIGLAPAGLEHVFFSDSGSTSVEVALKMALGYWRNIGEPRHRIIVLSGGYHGDSVGAMSVGERGIFTEAYEPLLFDVACIPFPSVGQETASLDALQALCARGDAAAFIVEPLVLGAGGMRMYSPRVLAEFHRICAQHGVLFIADEVMTGWGRTGTMFACEQAGISPRYCVLLEGIDRRCAAAGGDPVPARDLHGALCKGPPAHLFSFKLLHRQSHRVCCRSGESGGVGIRSDARSNRCTSNDADRATRPVPRRCSI